MRSKSLLVVAIAIAVVLTVTAVVAVVLEWWWLVAAAAMTLLSAAFLAALDADRRVRALRPYIRGEFGRSILRGKAGKPVLEAPPVSDVDVIGAVRVLQAQYTGRLDRMQESIDQAVAVVRAEGRAATPGNHADDQA